MTPTFLAQPALRLVGLQIRTKPMSPEIPALWLRFAPRMAEVAPALEPDVTWGAMRDTGDALLYHAAIAVAPDVPVPEGMTALDVPALQVAVFEFPFGDIGRAYPAIFGEWLPRSGFEQAAAPLLERYGADFCPDQPASPMQVRVPVRPRAGA
jgi:AraC family transcriptional regulator